MVLGAVRLTGGGPLPLEVTVKRVFLSAALVVPRSLQ